MSARHTLGPKPLIRDDDKAGIWLAQGSEKRAAVRDMFDGIAPSYDLLNSILSLRLHRRWRAFAVRLLDLEKGDRALDLCCGTGDFMTPLEKKLGADKVLGLDFSIPMLKIAKKKRHVRLAAGDACRLPVRSASLDAVTVGWGIRNVPEPDRAHEEISRVLKPGGRFISLDMARPRNPVLGAISRVIFGGVIPLIGGLFGKRKAYTYLPQSTRRFLSREELCESMRRAGFVDVGWRDMFFGNICLHWGRRP